MATDHLRFTMKYVCIEFRLKALYSQVLKMCVKDYFHGNPAHCFLFKLQSSKANNRINTMLVVELKYKLNCEMLSSYLQGYLFCAGDFGCFEVKVIH